MIFAYKTYILPLLDYCSPVWSPNKLSDIDSIESVQRSFTKRLDGMEGHSYSERLLLCDLPSLELRRLKADLVLCFSIVHNLISLNFDDFFQLYNGGHSTRGHSLKLKIPNVRSNVRKHFFAVRIVPVWNSLPNNIVINSSLVSLTALSTF